LDSTTPASIARQPTVIEISISAMSDDGTGSPYRGRAMPTIILSSTVNPSKRTMHYTHLGFPFKWEKFIFERDGKYIWHCWLLPFMLVHTKISCFDLVMDNLGDGQVGIYLKIAKDAQPYHMVIIQDGTRDREVEEYAFKQVRYAVARVNEIQTVRIATVIQEEIKHA